MTECGTEGCHEIGTMYLQDRGMTCRACFNLVMSGGGGLPQLKISTTSAPLETIYKDLPDALRGIISLIENGQHDLAVDHLGKRIKELEGD